MINISFNNSGTHALQSLFELTNLPEEENTILNSLKNDIMNMSYVYSILIYRIIMLLT